MSLNDQNGLSTTKEKGKFAYQSYWSKVAKKELIQWDYRATTGKLYSGVAFTVELAKEGAAKQSGEQVI